MSVFGAGVSTFVQRDSRPTRSSEPRDAPEADPTPASAGNAMANPSFATRAEESPRQAVYCGSVLQGRHHKGRGHCDIGVPSDMILGGGWAGRPIFNR